MSDEKVYHLVFGPSDSFTFAKYLMPGFQHVHVFNESNGRWVLVDPAMGALVCEDIGGIETAPTMLKHYLAQNPSLTILTLKVRENASMPVWRIGPISCVSTIQYLLGIYWPLTVTPYALYSKLITQTPSHIRIIADERIGNQTSQESSESS